MKKQALIIALLAAAGFASTSAFASDGTITFTGEIRTTTCSVSGGGGTIPGAGGSFGVNLVPVQASALAAAGQFAGSKNYDINIGGGTTCPDGTDVAIKYESTSPAVDGITGNLMNTAATGAANVQLQLMDRAINAPIDLRLDGNSSTVTVDGGTAVVPFAVRYMATGVAGAGAVQSAVQYSLTFP